MCHESDYVSINNDREFECKIIMNCSELWNYLTKIESFRYTVRCTRKLYLLKAINSPFNGEQYATPGGGIFQ